MKYIHRIFIWSIILLIIVLSGINLYLTLKISALNDLHSNNFSSLDQKISNLQNKINSIPNNEGLKDGYTPVKGIDYFDGNNGKDGYAINGIDGKDSKSTHILEKETIIKEVPIPGPPGLTPEIQCNTLKNRWEIRFGIDSNYQLMGTEPVKCDMGL